MTKIIFFGTSSFAAEALRGLAADSEIAIDAVVTAPDKAVGRHQEITASPVAAAAAELGMTVMKPERLRDPEFLKLIAEHSPDAFVVAAYGKILPQALLDIPRFGALNIHGSLLPKYRGASPIQAAIAAGETTTGITMMLMDSEIDHGNMLAKYELDIPAEQTAPELESRLAELAREHIAADLKSYVNGGAQGVEQDHDSATFTEIIAKEDGAIDWNRPSSEIYNQFRAYYAWPGIHTSYDGKRFKILDCRPSEVEAGLPVGAVFVKEDRCYVTCGSGSLELLEVQLEGKKAMSIADFLNGQTQFSGTMLNS